ncbi:MAG: glycosyltransferase family 92 protein [Chlamydiia bacterium]|nr:glycosyltransferase family 92 protein [Chlamydiia bacterium]
MKKLWWLTLPLILALGPLFQKKSHKLAVGSIFRNEAPYLKEWIDHHIQLGVTHFFLYNNESTDSYQDILKPYVDQGIVTLIDWESTEAHAIHGFGEFTFVPYQLGAYQDCIQRAKGVAEWIAIIDIDEYLVPNMSPKAFFALLDTEKKEKTGSLQIHWKVFGTSGVYALKEGEKLTEKLIHRATEDHPWNAQVKCLHQPKAVRRCLVHEAKKLHKGYAKKTLPKEVCRVHHYWFGTEKDFYQKRNFDTISGPPFIDMFNAVEDHSMEHFVKHL